MNIKKEIFRQYDIRGVVGQELTPETVTLLGKGIGTYFRNQDRREVALGRDCRLSSPELAKVLTESLLSTGCDVIDLGVVPTPLLYFFVYYKNTEAGVMITGSHNPPEYNGFKMMAGKETLYGETILDIHKIIQSEAFLQGEKGTQKEYNIRPEYEDYIASNIELRRKLKIVVDAGNGTGGAVAVPLFKRLGCDVTELYCEMDGNFPHHHPDPTLPEALEDLIHTVT